MDEQEHAERLHAVLKTLPHYTQSMKHAHWFPARTPRYAKEDIHLQVYFPPGIDQLYTHQTQVLSALQSAQAVAVATSVASGKTCALALPARIAHAKAKHQRTTLLCLVSTKALARQWQRRLQAWDRTWHIETITGDTKQEKKYAFAQADALIVTPEQLHASILPHHYQWKAFLGALHSVILDDCQEYRGLFGSHVGLVLRRLQRVILSYRETLPHFLLASALIGNPKDHAEHLLGQTVEVIGAAQDGSAFAGCLHLLWQPPNNTRFADEAARLLALFIRQGYRVVVFAQARQAVERIVNRAREDLPKHLQEQVRPYRGGMISASGSKWKRS